MWRMRGPKNILVVAGHVDVLAPHSPQVSQHQVFGLLSARAVDKFNFSKAGHTFILFGSKSLKCTKI